MWTPPVNESAELTRGALQLILYSEDYTYSSEGIGLILDPLGGRAETNAEDWDEDEGNYHRDVVGLSFLYSISAAYRRVFKCTSPAVAP